MKKNFRKYLTAAALALVAASGTAQTDYTQYVDPFIGCAATGHTFPGATVPFGFVQASPITGAIGWHTAQAMFTATPASGDSHRTP
jgi:putative alpha-1,2-mannosidase